jgi:hypothetical protein
MFFEVSILIHHKKEWIYAVLTKLPLIVVCVNNLCGDSVVDS